MTEQLEKNEYSMAGWLAIAAAVLTLPMFGLGFVVEIVGKKAPGVAMMVLLPYIVITLCDTAFSIYAFITIAAAACFALVITAPLGMIIDAVGNVVLALLFLKPEVDEPEPEFV